MLPIEAAAAGDIVLAHPVDRGFGLPPVAVEDVNVRRIDDLETRPQHAIEKIEILTYACFGSRPKAGVETAERIDNLALHCHVAADDRNIVRREMLQVEGKPRRSPARSNRPILFFFNLEATAE